MRVCYVTMMFPVESEAFAAVEIRALRHVGVDVSVLTFGPQPRRASQLLDEHELSDLPVRHGGLVAYIVGLIAAVHRFSLSLSLLRLLFIHYSGMRQLLVGMLLVPRVMGMFEQVRRSRPDVVHLFWGHYPSLLGYVLGKGMPQQVVTTSLGAYDLRAAFGPAAVVARQAAFVRTWSRNAVPAIASMGVPRENIRVIYRGIDTAAFQARRELPRRNRSVMYAGRLIASKRVDRVLKAFDTVRRDYPDATLRVAGDGPARRRLSAMVQSQDRSSVTFVGHLNHQQLYSSLTLTEVFLFLSAHPSERLPNVVKEAMAAGCVCIVSGTPGIEELVEHEVSGFVVTSDEEAIECLRRCFAAPELVARIGKAAQHRIRCDFDAHCVAEQLRSAWQDAWAGGACKALGSQAEPGSQLTRCP